MDELISYVTLIVDRGDGAPVNVAVKVDPDRLNILAALATLPGLAFDVTVSRIATFPIPEEQTGDAERMGLSALYAAIKDYFPVAG